jgi:hypothetical protein
VSREELVGMYAVTYPFGRGSLRLAADGSYIQELEIGGDKISAVGTWRHSAEGWFADVTLDDCLSATDGFGRLNQGWRIRFRGACVVPVTRRFVAAGAVELADDEDYHYRKRR